MSAEEIIEAARHAHGGEEIPEVTDNRRLGSLGRATAERLLGKAEDLNPNFDYAVAPNVFYLDMDSDLAKKGAETARALKASGFLMPAGERRMA